MGKTLPYDPNAICEICGAKGASDVYGDILCPGCIVSDDDTDEADDDMAQRMARDAEANR